MSTIFASHLGQMISFITKTSTSLLKKSAQRLISGKSIFWKYLANFKLTISDKKGKSMTKELKDNDANPLLGLQLGNEIDAGIVTLSGKLVLTGGSDKSGVPMRQDIHGGARKYILLSKGIGLHHAEKGQRLRKLMRGNTISEEIYQINCKFDGEFPETKVEQAPADEKPQETKE